MTTRKCIVTDAFFEFPTRDGTRRVYFDPLGLEKMHKKSKEVSRLKRHLEAYYREAPEGQVYTLCGRLLNCGEITSRNVVKAYAYATCKTCREKACALGWATEEPV